MSSSFSSSTSSVDFPMNGSQSVTDKLLTKEVQCECENGQHVKVRVLLLLQCKAFKDTLKILNLSPAELPDDLVFPARSIPVDIFKIIIEWMVHHEGKPDPIIETNPITGNRKWFTLDEFETNFFEIEIKVLVGLLNASIFLDLKSLYIYGCQSVASLLRSKNADEIRAIFGIEDDLTEDQKEQIRRKNVWYSLAE